MREVNVIPLVPLARVVDADQLRRELREQIEVAASAAEAVERAKAAITRAWRASRAADAVIAEREAGVETALTEHHGAIAAAHTVGEASPAPTRVRIAKQAVEDAKEDAEDHIVAHRNLKAELPTLQAAARDAETQVDATISAILVGPAEHLVEQAEELVAKLEPIAQALRSLVLDGEMPRLTMEELFARQRGESHSTSCASAPSRCSTPPSI